jgi:hypothetical protein
MNIKKVKIKLKNIIILKIVKKKKFKSLRKERDLQKIQNDSLGIKYDKSLKIINKKLKNIVNNFHKNEELNKNFNNSENKLYNSINEIKQIKYKNKNLLNVLRSQKKIKEIINHININ